VACHQFPSIALVNLYAAVRQHERILKKGNEVARRDIFAIGASAGGIAALRQLASKLPSDFPGSILIVLHISPESNGLLPHILANSGPLPANNAVHNEPVLPGQIYVAPPNQHLLVSASGAIQISHGPKENRFRPAIDPLFRSVALVYGHRAAGIILSGALDDGTSGLCAIKRQGGLAIVQDPGEAEVPSMPQSALRHVKADYCLSIDAIAGLLPRLAREAQAPAETQDPAHMPDDIMREVEIAADETSSVSLQHLSEPSRFTCPECSGSLFTVQDSAVSRFRCHTGHAFTLSSLEAELRGSIEQTSWAAIRVLQEHAMLLTEAAALPETTAESKSMFIDKAESALRKARLIRTTLLEA
jgi:two-component system chemotaxis response regulator CheB